MNITFLTQGCRSNISDSGWLETLARKRNFTVVDEVVCADAVIINSCTVTHRADRDCRQLVRRVKRLNPEAQVCLVGCYSQMNPDLALEGVSFFGGTSFKDRVLDFLENKTERFEGPYRDTLTFQKEGFLRSDAIPHSSDHSRCFLKIQDGCDHRCTYCIISTARGPSRSLSLDEVLGLIKKSSELGFSEVVLTGVDLGSFGGDVLGRQGLLALLQEIEKNKLIPRVRLSSLSPTEIPNGLIDFISESEVVCPSFHISLQHWSEKILRKMGRSYKAHDFESRVERIYKKMPNPFVSFDVIVGFPGESNDDVGKMSQWLESIPWTRGHYFPYSPRQGTPSATWPYQVPSTIVSERMSRLLQLDEARYQRELKKQLGQEVEVLLESQERLIQGHTREYFPVMFLEKPQSSSEIVKAKVESLHVEGEPVLGVRAV